MKKLVKFLNEWMNGKSLLRRRRELDQNTSPLTLMNWIIDVNKDLSMKEKIYLSEVLFGELYGDKSFKEQCVENLKQEINHLNQKLESIRGKGDFPMYGKLINAYKEVLSLIDRHDFELTYSVYTAELSALGEEPNRQIAIWKQNSDGVVRDHKVFTLASGKENLK